MDAQPDRTGATTRGGGSQTLARGLRALALIGEAEAPLAVAELAQRLGIHRSMAYRLVATLEEQGFAERDDAGALAVGPRIASLARVVAKDLQTAASPELEAAADELGMTAFLVTYDGECAVTLQSAMPRNAAATIAQRPGNRHPVDHGAPGRVIRSQLDPAAHPPQRFERSHDEVLPGIASIAVPVAVPGGRPAAVAALELTRFADGERTERVVARLEEAARRIAAAMR